MANENKITNELVMIDDDPTKTLAGRDEFLEGLQAQDDERDDTTGNAGKLARQAGKLACAEVEIAELKAQLERTEAYADKIRHQLQDQSSESDRAIDTREFLQVSLQRTIWKADILVRQLGRMLPLPTM